VTAQHRILVFGGTFDPPTLAHAALPLLVARRLGCDRILFVPARVNPLKALDPPTAPAHRLAMLKLAVGGVRNAEIDEIELQRQGPSYTVDTLEAFARRWPGAELRLLLGADQALELDRWKEPERILSLATPAVALRPPWDRQAFAAALREHYSEPEAARRLTWLIDGDLPRMDVSSTDARQRIAAGRPVDDLLDRQVISYIRSHGLYGSARPVSAGSERARRDQARS
jgi:nicotinate-nucleotide adenylyltransferase